MKVLLVDDEADIRTIGRLSLERIGKLETLVAASAREAIVLAKADRPDVILLDVLMPEIDGLATFAALREDPALATIPVVFLTGRASEADALRYLAIGAIGVIAKPFDPMELPAAVHRMFEHWMLRNHGGGSE